MNNNIDSRIREEFERLGLNIVESDRLAELIIARVRRDRMKRIFAGFGISLLIVGAIALAVAMISKSGSPSNQANGSSL
jgi:hypothetical protein